MDVEPRPPPLRFAQIRSPWISTILRQIARPRPEPPEPSLVRLRLKRLYEVDFSNNMIDVMSFSPWVVQKAKHTLNQFDFAELIQPNHRFTIAVNFKQRLAGFMRWRPTPSVSGAAILPRVRSDLLASYVEPPPKLVGRCAGRRLLRLDRRTAPSRQAHPAGAMADRPPRLSAPHRFHRAVGRPPNGVQFMSTRILGAAIAALLLLPAAATQAAQFQASPGIFDGGNGAFDAFGFYNSGVGELGQARQVDLLSGNVYRFLDTFTNKGTVHTTLNFFGNLGSDGDELVQAVKPGLLVSCEDDGLGHGGSDPVLALVSGNKGLDQAAITPDRYNVRYTLAIKPGGSVSLLNLAFLASEAGGPTAADWSLTVGTSLLQTPRLEGLDRQQIASIANFSISPVPEPATLGMMALGLVALRLQSRRSPKAGQA